MTRHSTITNPQAESKSASFDYITAANLNRIHAEIDRLYPQVVKALRKQAKGDSQQFAVLLDLLQSRFELCDTPQQLALLNEYLEAI